MSKEPFRPSQKVLERYADVMVNFALGHGKGIKKGDVVLVSASEVAKPLYAEILKAVWKAGGHVIGRYRPSNEPWFKFDRAFYEIASDAQLDFFAEKSLKGQVEQIDHSISVIATNDKQSLRGIDSKKIMRNHQSGKQYSEWLYSKEYAGKFTWTGCLYGTEEMAKEAGLSIKEYWDQIVRACYLDKANPLQEWRKTEKLLASYRTKLDALKIEKLHVVGPDADLWVRIGNRRAWKSGGGANIPSFEVFTSPDWRGTEGWIRFNQPLLAYGNRIEGIELEFKNGRIVKAKAKKNEKLLKDMIASPNADKIGEFSLTDSRLSRVTKFMAETLYDENVGGAHGNTHIAIGNAYKDCFDGEPSKMKAKDWEKLGYNSSSVHRDIVSTAPRTVTAHLKDGTEKIIYKNGKFVL